MKVSSPSLNVTLTGCDLASPIVLAAGTCGYLDELSVALDLSRIGGVTTKSITPLARDGNAPMRELGLSVALALILISSI